jgi:hypothetical protein
MLSSHREETRRFEGDSQRGQVIMPREQIEPKRSAKRYVRRSPKGRFTKKQVKVGRSLAADRRSKAKTIVKKGEGDRGDQRRSK